MEKKYRVGYTTGVFDLFHIGHLNILKCSKEMCDYLIVGVSTDELVWEYKHKKTIIPYEERVAIVNAIRYVDEVVPQTTMDKMLAWESLRFNAMFHGDDWKGSPLYDKYQAEFQTIGVDLVFIKYTKGISSTEISKEIRGQNE